MKGDDDIYLAAKAIGEGTKKRGILDTIDLLMRNGDKITRIVQTGIKLYGDAQELRAGLKQTKNQPDGQVRFSKDDDHDPRATETGDVKEKKIDLSALTAQINKASGVKEEGDDDE